MNKIINRIRKWSIERKRIFSISIAIFLTILIIILNSGINILWKKESNNRFSAENNSINLIKESFKKIFDIAKPALEQAISSSTEIFSALSAQPASSTSSTTEQIEKEEKIVDQINSTSSSFGTSSGVIE